KESKKLLTIILKNKIKISQREGKELFLYFDALLEIANVTQKIFGANKYREFTRKQSISVAKTSVHVLFDASGSQILVPESQSSAVEELMRLKEKPNPQKEFSKPPKYITNSKQGDRKNNQLEHKATPQRRRIKPPLQMMSSAEKPGVSKTLKNGVDNGVSLKSRPSEGRKRGDNTDKHIKTAKVVEKTENKDIAFLNQNFNEQDIVPDLQAVGKIDKNVFYDVLDICGNKIHSKWACWTPVTNINLCNKQRASTSSGDMLNQDTVTNKKCTKQKSSSSISDDNSEEIGKVQYEKERTQHNKTDKAEAEVCKGNNQQLSHPEHSEQKNMESTEQSDWHIESETTFKSVLLNKRVEESLIYRKKCILSKDVNTAICDKSSSPRKNVNSHTKSGKRLTSELKSWDLKPEKMEKVQIKSYRQLKTTFVNVTSERPLNDVYNFNLNGADEPAIKLGVNQKTIQEFQATATEACVDNSIKLVGLRNHDELEPSFKTKDKRSVTNHKKKNVFSDSDTENRYDDSKTDISWLREPKSKPQLIDYSRNKNVKKHKIGKSRTSLERGKPRSKSAPKRNITKKADEVVPDGRTRLPRRVAKTRKNYKDLSNSESESEQEFSNSFKEKLPVKEENIHSRSKTRKSSEKQQNAFSAETKKDISKEWKNSSLLKDTMGDNTLELSPISLSGSPSFIEVMRCPTQHLSRKRMYIEDDLRNFDEVEFEEEGRAYLFPKKLPKTEDANRSSYRVSGSISPLSSNDFSIPEENLETEISDVRMICEMLNTEFKRKAHIRKKMMDYFTKQSWRTAQQHLKTINHQIQECRIKKLDRFQFIIKEELKNFEKDSQSLKDLEKEFVDCWEKIFQKFSAFQKNEQQRHHLLKASLDKNVFYNTNYDDTMFTSEV
ncbi:hypothetical protein MC885_020619, partial [Smutsia gigantea]